MGENLRSRGSLFAKTAAAAMAVVLAMGLASYSQAYAADAAEGQGGAILAAGIASADNAGATALSTQADEVTALENAQAKMTAFQNAITEDGVVDWATIIRATLSYNRAAAAGADVSELTAYYASIEKLDLSGQSIEDNGVYTGTDTGSLVVFTGLKELDLSNTDITSLGGLAPMTQLETVNLSGNSGIGTRNGDSSNNLGALASSAATLKSLDLSGTGIDVAADCGLFASTENLEVLNLSNTNFDNNSFGPIVALKSLKSLDLSNNPDLSSIGPITMNGVGSQTCARTIETLDVSNTGLAQLQELAVSTPNGVALSLISLKTLVAHNLDLSHSQPLSGLVQIAEASTFDPSGITWDLAGSVVADTESGHVSRIATKFTTGTFVAPSVGSNAALVMHDGVASYYQSLAEAVAAAVSGDTVQLTTDVTEPGFTIDDSITLDLGGHTATITDAALTFAAGESVVKNGTIASAADDVITATNGGMVTLGEGLVVNAQSSALWAHEGGSIVVDGAAVTSTSSQYVAAAAYAGSTIDVKSGLLVSENYGTLNVYGSSTISGGLVETKDDFYVAIYAWGESPVLNIAGGTVKSEKTAALSACAGTTTISGGTLVSGDSLFTVGSYGNNPTLAITGGTIQNTSATGHAVQSGNVYYGSTGKTAITGGTFIATGEATAAEVVTDGSELVISGGFFSSPVNEEYCAPGYSPIVRQYEDGSVTYTVEDGVEHTIAIGNVYNGTVVASAAKAEPGETITLTLTPKGLDNESNEDDFAIGIVDIEGLEEPADSVVTSFVMPAHNVTVNAYFIPARFKSALDWSEIVANEATSETPDLSWDQIITADHWYEVARDIKFDDDGTADTVGTIENIRQETLAAVEANFAKVTALDMAGKKTSEHGYAVSTGALRYFTNLETLGLSDTGISDYGGLAYLTKLESLDLSDNPQIDDAAHGAIGTLAQLKSLDLSGTTVTDLGGLAGSAAAQSLESIDVSDTAVSKFETVWDSASSAAAFPVLKTLDARNLENLTSLSGLVNLTKVGGFTGEGLTWDLSGGKMYDPQKQVQTLIDAFATSAGSAGNTGSFLPPEVVNCTIVISPESIVGKPGATQQLAATLAPVAAQNDFTVAWSSSDENVATVDQDGKVTLVAQGSASITATATDRNGNRATSSIAVVVEREVAAEFTVSITGWTYGEEAHAPSVTGNASGGEVAYEYAVAGSDSYSATVPTDAGSYIVRAKVAATETHAEQTATAEFAIAKADIAPVVSIEGWTYGNAANAPTLAGNTGNGSVAYTYAVKGSDEFSTDVPANAGDYTVKAEIAATANYNSAVATADFTIAKAAIIPTVTITGWTYGEVANLPKVEGNTGNGRVTYEYTNKATESTSVYLPQVVGNFTLKATIAETDNYQGGEATVDFTVAKAPISNIVPPTAKTDLVYTGQVQALITRGSATGGVMEYSTKSDPDSFSSAIPTGTDVGRYPIYYRVVGDSNHESTGVFGLDSSDRITAVIEAVPSSLYVLPTAIDIDYDGQPHSLLASGGRAMNGTVMYSLKAGTGYSTEFPEATDAGVYRVYYMVKADPNYADTEPQYVTARIRTIPAEADPVPEGAQLTYNGHVQTLIDPSTVEGNANKILFSLDGNNFDVRYPNATNAGDYEVRYKVIASDSNHHDSDPVGFVVTIEKGTAFPGVYLANWAYGQTAATPIMSGVEENAEVTFEYAPAKTENYSAELPTDAGKYTVRAIVAETANYKRAVATDNFTIFTSAATVDVAPAAIESLVYNGSSQALVVAGESDSGTMQYSLDGTNWLTDVPTAVNSGSYTVYFRVLGDSNHSDSGVGSVSVIVAPAEVDAIAPVAKALTYTGEEQALVEPGASDKGTVEYSLDGEEWSTEVPTATNAGNYPVMWRVIGSENYDSTDAQTINVSIARAETAEPTAPEAVANLAYNGQEQALVVPAVDEDREVLYSLDGEEWSTEVPTATNAGSYTVFAKVAGDANHNDSPIVSTDVTVAKASISPIATMTGWTYGDGSNIPRVVGDPGNGNKTYTYAPAGSSDYVATVPTEAGDYTVRVQIAETVNYEGAVATADFTIARANATVRANNAFKYEGADDPTLTATVTGLAAGENSSVISYTLRRASGETPATYNITAAGDTVQGNYNVSFAGATFTILESQAADDTPAADGGNASGGDQTNPSNDGGSGNGGNATPSNGSNNNADSGSNSGSNNGGSADNGSNSGSTDSGSNANDNSGSGSGNSGSNAGGNATPSNANDNSNSGSNNSSNANSGSSSNNSNSSGNASGSRTSRSSANNASSNAGGSSSSGTANAAGGTATAPASTYTPTAAAPAYTPTSATTGAAAAPAAATTTAPAAAGNADDSEDAEGNASTGTTSNRQSTTNRTQSISDNSNPLSSGNETIEDDANALAASASAGSWSLFNLIASIISVLVGAGLIALMAMRRNREGLDKKSMALAGSGLAVAIAAVATLLLTQDFSQPMGAVDAWSGLETAFVVAEAAIVGVAAATGRKSPNTTATA